MPGYVFILVLLLLMWFLLIRPQRRRQQETRRMVDSLRVGQEIVTAGGLYGTVTAVEADEVHLEVAEGVEVRIAKRAVAGIVSVDDELDQEDEDVDADETEEEAAEPPVRDSGPGEGAWGNREVPPAEKPVR